MDISRTPHGSTTTTFPAVTVSVAVTVAVAVSRSVTFSVIVTRSVTVVASTPAPFAWPGPPVPVTLALTLTAGTAVVVTATMEVEVIVVVVVLSSTGTTLSVSLVVVEVARVVGPRTVVKEREAGREKCGRRWEDGVTVDSGTGLATSGSMVRVRTAVPIVAVRVTRLVAGGVVVVVELGEEVAEEGVVVVRGGSTVTYVVPMPEVVSITTVVMVLRAEVDCEEPVVDGDAEAVDAVADDALETEVVEAPVESAVDERADELGTSASGTVPRICLATAILVQPRITPSVVFMGRAKQAVSAIRQGVMSKPPAAAHVAIPPATHAVWPALQADCAVRVAKRSLNSRASCRFF